MKKFIGQYLRVIAYTTIGLMLFVSGFYLIMNYYHSEELKTSLYITPNDVNYQSYISKLEQIQSNLDKFNKNRSTNKAYNNLYIDLLSCNNFLNSFGTLSTIEVNTFFDSYDVYQLGDKLQSNLLNACWAVNLSYLIEEDVPVEFKSISPYLKTSINLINNQTNSALTEIQNNSSYFYSTSVSSATIRNYLNSDYQMISNSYNNFADIILNLSLEINKVEDGGNIND